MVFQGSVFALTGKASDAVQMHPLRHYRYAINGIDIVDTAVLIVFDCSLCATRHIEEAWRCIDEALTLIENDGGTVVRG